MKIQYSNEKHKHLPHPKVPITEDMVWDVVYDYLNSHKRRIDWNSPEFYFKYIFPEVPSVLYIVSNKHRNIGTSELKPNRKFFFESKRWEHTISPIGAASDETIGKIYLSKKDKKKINEMEQLIRTIDAL